jgi:hypothetical protein
MVETIDGDALKLRSPFFMIVSGPSMSGKTRAVVSLLERMDEIVEGGALTSILFCYNSWQELYAQFGISMQQRYPRTTLTWVKGFPECFMRDALKADSIEDLVQRGGEGDDRPPRPLVVLDDMAVAAMDSEAVNEMATRIVHHLGISLLIFTHQIYYSRSRYGVLIQRQVHYYLLFPTVMDANMIRILSSRADWPAWFLPWALADVDRGGDAGSEGCLLVSYREKDKRLCVRTLPLKSQAVTLYTP